MDEGSATLDAVSGSGEAGVPTSVPDTVARVAARLFAERGYEATSVREIVEAARVTKPTLYYHFGSKEGLAQALLVLPQAVLVEEMRTILAREADPVVALEALLERLFEFCREDPDRARLMFAVAFGPLGADLAGKVKQCGCVIDEFWEAAIARLAATGLVATERVPALVLAVRGLHIIYILEFLYKGRALGREVAREIVRDLLVGFGEPAEARAYLNGSSPGGVGASGE